MSDELLQTTVTVTGLKGDKYEFTIPGLHAEFQVSARVKDIRKATDPDWDGFPNGLDFTTQYQMRGCAVFEVLLRKTDAEWVFTPGPDGKPVVNSALFGPDKVDEVEHVYTEYLAAVGRFRKTGSADPKPKGAKVVDGEPDTGAAPVPG